MAWAGHLSVGRLSIRNTHKCLEMPCPSLWLGMGALIAGCPSPLLQPLGAPRKRGRSPDKALVSVITLHQLPKATQEMFCFTLGKSPE